MFPLASGFAAILSIVFLVSAAGKFADRSGTASGLRSLQIPFAHLHPLMAIAVPTVEVLIAVGVWIPVRGVAVVATASACALMIAFTVVIARALRLPDAVHCSCFGTLGSPTVTTGTLVRNILLTVTALVAFMWAAVGPGRYPGQLLSENPIEAFLLAVVLLLAGAITVLIVGGTDRLAGEGGTQATSASAVDAQHPGEDDSSAQDEGEYMRTPIPFASLTRQDSSVVTLRELASQQAVLLVFLSENCGPCITLFPKVRQWRESLEPAVRVVTVFKTRVDLLGGEAAELLGDTPMQEVDSSVSTIFGLSGTPGAVLLGADGLVAGGPVGGSQDVSAFVDDIIEQLAAVPDIGEQIDAARAHDDVEPARAD